MYYIHKVTTKLFIFVVRISRTGLVAMIRVGCVPYQINMITHGNIK